MSDNQLRILTYNTHKGFSANNRHFILHRLRDALRATDADVLFLQEMQGAHSHHQQTQSNWPDCSHSEFIAEDVWPFHTYGQNAVYSKGHHGNAILSKYPLSQCENINVSPVSWASRSLLHAVVTMPNNQEIHIICIHFGLIGIERRRQFELLSKRIEQEVPSDSMLIVAGDFNDWTEQAQKRLANYFDLKEAYHTLHNRHARTWPAWLPMLKMDRIFYRGLTVTSCERPRYGAWHQLSDHAPLVATFEL